jgi:hypothetical protein
VLLRDVKRRNPTRRPSVSPITRPRRVMGGEVSGWEDWNAVAARAGNLIKGVLKFVRDRSVI